jgi:DNA-binding CsgD family transcriptional regulator
MLLQGTRGNGNLQENLRPRPNALSISPIDGEQAAQRRTHREADARGHPRAHEDPARLSGMTTMTTQTRCINYPCALPAGHDGRCSSSDPENREQDGKQEPVGSLEGSNELAVKRLNDLSAKDWQICMRIAQGDSGPEIAELMGLKLQTIHNRLNKLFKEISVRNRYELAAWTGVQLCEAELASKDATIAELREANQKLMISVNAVAGGSAQVLMLHAKINNAYDKGRRDQCIDDEAKITWLQQELAQWKNKAEATRAPMKTPRGYQE